MTHTIPSSLEPIWNDLYEEVTWLNGRWHVYQDLYLKSDIRVDLLNTVDGTFFAVLQAMLVEYFVIAISRLTDRHKSKSQDNAVLELLSIHPAIAVDTVLATAIQAQLAALAITCKPIRRARNKQVAHRDLKVALKAGATPLSGVTTGNLEKAVGEIGGVINTVSVHFTRSEILFAKGIWGIDAGGLLSTLKAGQYCEEGMQSGSLPWDFLDKSRYRDV